MPQGHFDSQVVGTLLDGCRGMDNVRVMVITDHLTPVRIRTHARGLVPYAICDLPGRQSQEPRRFCEQDAARTGLVVKPGHLLMETFIQGNLQKEPNR